MCVCMWDIGDKVRRNCSNTLVFEIYYNYLFNPSTVYSKELDLKYTTYRKGGKLIFPTNYLSRKYVSSLLGYLVPGFGGVLLGSGILLFSCLRFLAHQCLHIEVSVGPNRHPIRPFPKQGGRMKFGDEWRKTKKTTVEAEERIFGATSTLLKKKKTWRVTLGCNLAVIRFGWPSRHDGHKVKNSVW